MAEAAIKEEKKIIDEGLEVGAQNLTADRIQKVINRVLKGESGAGSSVPQELRLRLTRMGKIACEQIDLTVVVEIAPRRADTVSVAAAHSVLPGLFGKVARTVVQPHAVALAAIGHERIEVAVAIHVAD